MAFADSFVICLNLCFVNNLSVDSTLIALPLKNFSTVSNKSLKTSLALLIPPSSFLDFFDTKSPKVLDKSSAPCLALFS